MEKVMFQTGDGLELEGLLDKTSGQRGVVIVHPHPLYGGDMVNPVVESLSIVYRRKGYSTLRFNFRGVGNSQGGYDDGVGEQKDILAAIQVLQELGMTTIHLAAYSFGSWVVAKIDSFPKGVEKLVFVSPPLALMPFADTCTLPLLDLVVTGEDDEFAPPNLLESTVKKWNPEGRLEVVDHADHFYFGSFPDLERIVGSIL
ncbi:alpha/beta hydrolase [Desulfopila sp. IMCC35008]|uniref:alpha/beta hydrolase n=1 Tax=Desulfopila sp. IMCC35008 TaxID=2653858 RepID=UPI0013D65CA5|nr:alpha/beta hydrolase [Desulfopila sp. IMCC35008]